MARGLWPSHFGLFSLASRNFSCHSHYERIPLLPPFPPLNASAALARRAMSSGRVATFLQFSANVKGIVVMKKKTAIEESTAAATSVAGGLEPLIAEVRSLIRSARYAAASTVNTLLVLTNFEIGRRIVEQEQNGARRAEYGAEILKELSARLTEEFGRGFSKANLEYLRRFYVTYQIRRTIAHEKEDGR